MLEARALDRFGREGTMEPEGFRRLLGEEWLFPREHRSPTGALVSKGCASAHCRVSYRLTEGVDVKYAIDRRGAPVTDDWIGVDDFVRSVVLSWIDFGA